MQVAGSEDEQGDEQDEGEVDGAVLNGSGESKTEGKEKFESVGEISVIWSVAAAMGVHGCAGEGGVSAVVALGVACCTCPCTLSFSLSL